MVVQILVIFQVWPRMLQDIQSLFKMKLSQSFNKIILLQTSPFRTAPCCCYVSIKVEPTHIINYMVHCFAIYKALCWSASLRDCESLKIIYLYPGDNSMVKLSFSLSSTLVLLWLSWPQTPVLWPGSSWPTCLAKVSAFHSLYSSEVTWHQWSYYRT